LSKPIQATPTGLLGPGGKTSLVFNSRAFGRFGKNLRIKGVIRVRGYDDDAQFPHGRFSNGLEYEPMLESVSEKARHIQAWCGASIRTWIGPTWPRHNSAIAQRSFPSPATHCAYFNHQCRIKSLKPGTEARTCWPISRAAFARQVEKRPVGELRVVVIARTRITPLIRKIFPESAEARELKTKLVFTARTQ